MKNNMGLPDRLIRALMGILLGAFYFTGYATGQWGILSLVAGSILVITALLGICPLYKIAGLKTNNSA